MTRIKRSNNDLQTITQKKKEKKTRIPLLILIGAFYIHDMHELSFDLFLEVQFHNIGHITS